MKGHLGAIMTSGLAAVALALALLQAIVVACSSHRAQEVTAARSGQTNRYSVPGGRSGIPLLPFDKSRKPEQSPPLHEERRLSPPPPSRMRAVPPHLGPQQPRKMAA